MKLYEITYIALPDLSEEEIKSINEKIKDLIVKESGAITQESIPQKMSLGYSLNGKNEGILNVFSFTIDPEKISIIENSLKEENKIIRFAILKKKIEATFRKPPRKRIEKPKPELTKIELKELDQKIEEILKE